MRALSKDRWNRVITLIREARRCSAVRALSKERWDIVIIWLREALMIREERGGIAFVGGVVVIAARSPERR